MIENEILESSEIEITESADFTDGEIVSSTEIESMDYASLASDSMQFSFIICGIALITSLGIAVVIKIFKSSI